MTPADYCAAIAQALEMGPTEGEWVIDHEQGYGINTTTRHIALVSCFCSKPGDKEENEANAALISASQPAAMRSILEEREQTAIAFRIKEEECERLRKRVKSLEAAANYCAEDCEEHPLYLGPDASQGHIDAEGGDAALVTGIAHRLRAALKDPK